MVREPRQMPQLQLKTEVRMFQGEWYAKKDWLCGSEEENSLFCWPCLLFRPGVSQSWTETGYSNMRNILSDGKKHEKSSLIWRTTRCGKHTVTQRASMFCFQEPEEKKLSATRKK